jgi:hypothetical protein
MKKRSAYLFGLLLAAPSLARAQSGGQGFFNVPVSYSQTPDLYYVVVGGPPNTCGDLVASRNGSSWQTTPGWLCTDANGQALKGPWTWASAPGDETTDAYIAWPGGRTTSRARHIWDKTCPGIVPGSPYGAPASFSGGATDGFWGAGFLPPQSVVSGLFYDVTAGLYWDPGTGRYDSSVPHTVFASLSGLGSLEAPSYSLSWNFATLPRQHRRGHTYAWTAVLPDADNHCVPNPIWVYFTVPPGLPCPTGDCLD